MFCFFVNLEEGLGVGEGEEERLRFVVVVKVAVVRVVVAAACWVAESEDVAVVERRLVFAAGGF